VRSDLRRAMYAEACTYMTDDVLVKVDRASMSVGLEVRVPVLERRVAELAASLPLEHLLHGGQSKAPLRALVYRRVPRALLERPKQGFDFPIRALLGRELDAWTDEHLDPRRVAAQGLLRPEAVQRVVAGARRMGALGDARLWRLLCFQRWLAAHHPEGLHD
jgi:asparagine synthase (glutamine-hydrolysing)